MMTPGTSDEADVAARSRDWRRSALISICDVLKPWESGVVARCNRYPNYYEFNVVQVRQDPAMDVPGLIDFADRALAGLDHRRIDFERAESAGEMRAEFESRGWKSMSLLHMRYEGGGPADAAATVEEVPYDAVHDLRVAWHEEDFPGVDASAFFAFAREVALARGARVLAVRDGGVAIAYAQIECSGEAAEVTAVYVHPDHRGHGLGTALTSAAIRAAPPVRDLWITADDEDRPKQLYARLGFRPVARELQVLRLP
ncbi:MAG TPA: GNAT family N-acetyltransferase [Solirubrobacteraceae bacterium]|jgi:GNAT superfamily N-acetyltransferase